jgi:hypothetical protein
MNLSGSKLSGSVQYLGSLPVAHAFTTTLVLTGISYPFISHFSLHSLGSNRGAGGCNLRVSLTTSFKYFISSNIQNLSLLIFVFLVPFKFQHSKLCFICMPYRFYNVYITPRLSLFCFCYHSSVRVFLFDFYFVILYYLYLIIAQPSAKNCDGLFTVFAGSFFFFKKNNNK